MAKTSNKQRFAIWIILILMVASTAALYIGVIVTQQNTTKESRDQQKMMEEYEKISKEYQDKMDAQAEELSGKYYEDFKGYKDNAKAFNAANVKELKTEDLKVGDGEEITKDSTEFTAYYVGWKPDGTIFDSSIKDNALTNPISAKKTDGSWGLISGWSEGIVGMKIGGVRELTIPADKAYGSAGSQNDDKDKNIDPNTPLKFIVMLIPKPTEIPEPDFSALGL